MARKAARANLFELASGATSVTYATTGIAGQPSLHFRDADHDVNAGGSGLLFAPPGPEWDRTGWWDGSRPRKHWAEGPAAPGIRPSERVPRSRHPRGTRELGPDGPTAAAPGTSAGPGGPGGSAWTSL